MLMSCVLRAATSVSTKKINNSLRGRGQTPPRFPVTTLYGQRMHRNYDSGHRLLFDKNHRSNERDSSQIAVTQAEVDAWRWLFENEKLGVGQLIREDRWDDAVLFLNFVMWSYNSLMRDSPKFGLIASSSNPTPRQKQAVIDAMISYQLAVYQQIDGNEFFGFPVDQCMNPLAISVRIVSAATGTSTFYRSRLPVSTNIMNPHDAWNLLQSLLERVSGTRQSIKNIRDWAYRISSAERQAIILCAANFKGRIRRPMVPVIVTVFYVTLKISMKQNEEIAWSFLQATLSPMTVALRSQLCAHIFSYRKLGYFPVSNLGPATCCFNDKYLKVCCDLLNDSPKFLWHELHKSFNEKYAAWYERRRRFLSKPTINTNMPSLNDHIMEDINRIYSRPSI